MSEKNTIEKTETPITKTRIIQDLIKGGVLESDTILLHSSLSSLGWVIGKEMTVIDAFLEVLKKGTLVMPSQTGENSDPSLWSNPPVPESWIPIIKQNMPTYDKTNTSTKSMGRIVECFRHYKFVKRSNHPTSSFIAKGKHAKKITKIHDLTPAFGQRSPLGKLYHFNSKVILLGVSYDYATAFHLAEAMCGKLKLQKQETSFQNHWISYEDFIYDTVDFLVLGVALEHAGLVKTFFVGQAKTICFEMKPVIDFAISWFQQTR